MARYGFIGGWKAQPSGGRHWPRSERRLAEAWPLGAAPAGVGRLKTGKAGRWPGEAREGSLRGAREAQASGGRRLKRQGEAREARGIGLRPRAAACPPTATLQAR